MKNTLTSHTAYELNFGYHPYASLKENINFYPQLKSINKLSTKLKELMTICQKNFQNAKKLQKQYYNMVTKPKSYAPSDKV